MPYVCMRCGRNRFLDPVVEEDYMTVSYPTGPELTRIWVYDYLCMPCCFKKWPTDQGTVGRDTTVIYQFIVDPSH